MTEKKFSTANTFRKHGRPRFSQTKKKTARPHPSHPHFQRQHKPLSVETAKDKLKVTVMGGLEEVGRNMTVLEYENDIIIIDMGLQFPEENMPGIDYIIPNISSLREKTKKIRGVIITHGHFDHIGAIPHLMPELGNPPMYTGVLSSEIIKKRHEEYKNLPKLNITKINEQSKIKLGQNFTVEFFRVNHTIPDSFAVIVRTPVGTIVHTGDYKFDFTPINEQPTDFNRLYELGEKGVLALMADSTSAGLEGNQISETRVAEEMEKIFSEAKGRIVIGTFASLLSRIQIILTLAERFGRKIAIEGRSMQSNVEIAFQLGYFKTKTGVIVESEEAARLPDSKLVIVGTGAQAQENAFLMRYATDEHKYFSVNKGDIVIFSSSVIPGNERTVQGLKDTLYRKGARVIQYDMMDIHAGGHAKAEDVKMLVRSLKPKYYIPIEQYHYMLRMNAEIIENAGLVPHDKIFVADNGQVMEFDKAGMGVLTQKKVNADYVFVDGLGVGDVSEIVLRDRQMLAADGMMVLIATVDANTGQLVGSPDIISRGFVYLKENKKLIEQTRNKIRTILKTNDPKSDPDEMYMKNKLRNDIGQFLWQKTKRRPMILPVVIKV